MRTAGQSHTTSALPQLLLGHLSLVGTSSNEVIVKASGVRSQVTDARSCSAQTCNIHIGALPVVSPPTIGTGIGWQRLRINYRPTTRVQGQQRKTRSACNMDLDSHPTEGGPRFFAEVVNKLTKPITGSEIQSLRAIQNLPPAWHTSIQRITLHSSASSPETIPTKILFMILAGLAGLGVRVRYARDRDPLVKCVSILRPPCKLSINRKSHTSQLLLAFPHTPHPRLSSTRSYHFPFLSWPVPRSHPLPHRSKVAP